MGESESESDGSGQARAFKAGFDRCAAGRGRRLEGALTWRASLETGAAVQTGSGLVRDRERQKKTEERQRGQREDERQCREGQRETERDRECYSSSLYFI